MLIVATFIVAKRVLIGYRFSTNPVLFLAWIACVFGACVWKTVVLSEYYQFCHVTSEQLLKVIAYLYRMSIQKVSIVAVSVVENSRGRVTEAHDGFSLVGKALMVDI